MNEVSRTECPEENIQLMIAINGPEITVPKDTLFYGGWENRDIHNINGMLFVSLNLHILDGHSADSFSTIKLLKLSSIGKIHLKDHSSFLGRSLLVLNDLVPSGMSPLVPWQKLIF
jgi:hypothetical protein